MSSIADTLKSAVSNMNENAKVASMSHDIVDISDKNAGITTDHGVSVADTDNWLKVSNGRTVGPMLLEDQIAREKIHRFDHERIPEVST